MESVVTTISLGQWSNTIGDPCGLHFPQGNSETKNKRTSNCCRIASRCLHSFLGSLNGKPTLYFSLKTILCMLSWCVACVVCVHFPDCVAQIWNSLNWPFMWMQWTNLQALTVNPADFSSLLCTDFCTNNVITGESVLWMFWTGFCAVLKVVILRCTPSFHADKSSRPVFFLWNCCVVVLLLHVTINNVCGGTDLALVQEFLFCQGVFFFMELLFLHLFIDLCYWCIIFIFLRPGPYQACSKELIQGMFSWTSVRVSFSICFSQKSSMWTIGHFYYWNHFWVSQCSIPQHYKTDSGIQIVNHCWKKFILCISFGCCV